MDIESAEEYIDPNIEAFYEHFNESIAEIKRGATTLERAAREMAEAYDLSVGSMEIQLSEAIGKPMSLPYSDYWDRPASFLTEMCEQLELTLQARLASYLGGGKQGHVFLDSEQKVVKITRSLQEALLAHILLSRSDHAFPRVYSVESHLTDDTPAFLIRRDPLQPLIDFISEEQPHLTPALVKAAWAGIQRNTTSSHLTSSMSELEGKSPRLIAHLTDLARSIKTFRGSTGISVGDVHLENIGFVGGQSRLVVMDFGMNNIESVLGYSLLENIPKRLYEPTHAPRR